MEDGSLRVGVIGVGSMGQNHLRVYQELAEIVGFADVDDAKRKSLSSRFRIPGFANYEDLLQERPDAVSIASPTETHYRVAKKCLEAGVHVLVEKPICTTIEETEDLIRYADSQGLVIAAGHIERHNPVVAFAKRAVADGQWGDLITVSARRVSSFPDRVKDIGVILDLGIHEVDIERFLVGESVETVFARSGRHRHAQFEDYASILLGFEGGTTGVVEVNWLTPMKVRKLALTCSKNFVEMDYTSQSLIVSSSSFLEYDPANLYHVPLEYHVNEVRLQRQEPLRLELIDFIEAVRTGRRPLVTGEDALEVLRILDAAVRSCREGKPFRLD